jgi:hypothetical protein
LFWNRQPRQSAPEVAALEAEVAALKQRVVRAEQTVSDLAERAYKYMKKAESRARRELDESGADATKPSPGATVPATPPSSRRALWGARARRLMRRDPTLEIERDDDAEANGHGLHS